MTNIDSLRQRIKELKTAEPKLRSRDLAKAAGISEAELLALSLGENTIRLAGDWKELLKGLKAMDTVMALTRNEYCVHERKGIYDNISFYKGPHNMGVAVNPDIDLRFFMNEWQYGFAVIMPRGKMPTLYSFQFFNKKGEAVHKIYSTQKSDLAAYQTLVDTYKAANQLPIADIDTTPIEAKVIEADESIDLDAFQADWRGLKDTHDFFGMLRKHKVARTQGFRLAPEGFTQKVERQTIVKALEQAAEQAVPIMCFVHSKGCIQIHSGPINKLKFHGDWYNILDPQFNLHLKLSEVAETWIVKKPTSDGIVSSIELFDQNGELIVYFFGARKPGQVELESWRNILANLSPSKLHV